MQNIKIKNYYFIIALTLGFISGLSITQAQEQNDSIKTADPFQYVRLFSDSNGVSHFSDEQISFKLVNFAPPAPPISVSEILMTSGEAFIISSPSGWYGDWHPVPRRQLFFTLYGELEVEVSDGEIRTFKPGSVLLGEDTIGKGHISRIISEERVYMVVIPLPEH
jgi:hypothetical protein